MYAITGNYPAQDFFGINERDGRISVIKNLKEDVARANQYVVSYFCVENDCIWFFIIHGF